MEIWQIALIVVAAAVALALCMLFALAAASYKIAFGQRYDKNPLLKYFTAEDFGLSAEPLSINRGKFSIGGYIYRNERTFCKKEIIIFVHGMGAGHLAYTTEIAYFCGLGYAVIALDSKGCNLSGGKNIGGMYEGVKTAVAAIDYAKSNFPESKIYLVGHSWGGYSVLCASKERKLDKVIAISAPSSPVKTLREGAAPLISKFLAYMLCPFWWVVGFFKFGARGNANAAKCARKNATPTLLVHGDKDTIVTAVKGAYYAVYGENVTKFLASGKAHNPYNTVRAEQKLAELSAALRGAKKLSAEERERYFSNFDFKAATEEDEAVMTEMAQFLQN